MRNIDESMFDFIRYDKKNGKLFWQKRKLQMQAKVGDECGCLKRDGYKYFKFNGVAYLQHRIIWHIEKGASSEKVLDHINGNRSDNRIENLREASARENCQNQKRHRAGRLVGAIFKKQINKFIGQIRIDGICKHLGTFETEQDAHFAYVRKLNEIDGY